jgi:hypothetical protein
MASPLKYTHLSVAAALLVFPPLGFFLMYRDSYYHKHFPTLLYLGALTPFLLYLLQFFFVVPQLTAVYRSLGTPVPADSYTVLILLSLVSLLQIPLGITLTKKINSGLPYKNLLLTCIFFLMINFFLAGFAYTEAINSILQPIYNLTDYIR